MGDLLRGGVACNHHRSVEFIMEPPSSTCVHRTYPCDSWEMFKDGQCRKGPYGTLALDAENVRSGQSQFSVTKEMKPFCGKYFYLELKVFNKSRFSSSECFEGHHSFVTRLRGDCGKYRCCFFGRWWRQGKRRAISVSSDWCSMDLRFVVKTRIFQLNTVHICRSKIHRIQG